MAETTGLSALAAFVLSLLASIAATDPPPGPTCRAELAAVDDSFEETLARLDKAGKADQAGKCAAVAHHLEVMANGRAVYMRCLPSGHDRNENIAQLNASMADFRDIQANMKCK